MHEQLDSSIHRWQIGPSEFLASPTQGARLMQWEIRFGKGKVRPVIHWPESVDSNTPFHKIRGGNPILFPFAGRTFYKEEENAWKQGSEVLPMPRHGFARDGVFELQEFDNESLKAFLSPSPEAQKAYPFQYQFGVHYHFSELSFKVTLSLENQDSERIPWCAGHHFYFALPWDTSLSREHYQVQIPSKKAYYQKPDGKLEKVSLSENTFSLSDPALIDRHHYNLKENTVHFGPKSEEELVTIRLCDAPVPSTWTSLVTWTQSAESPFYCIEPWMGPPNAVSLGKGVRWVEPGQIDTFTVEVSLAG